MTKKARYVSENRFRAEHINPKTKRQDLLLSALRSNKQLIVTSGPAGVGKTYCVINHALNELYQGKTKRLILTRPNQPTGRSLGFFPGTVEEKLEPWLAPMVSIIRKRMSDTEFNYKKGKGVIVMQPLEVIRGHSFENSIVVVDEAQNLYWDELKSISTRIGQGSQLILMGDPMQKDIKSDTLTRFKFLTHPVREEIPFIEFNVDDIVRSDIVATLVRLFIKEESE